MSVVRFLIAVTLFAQGAAAGAAVSAHGTTRTVVRGPEWMSQFPFVFLDTRPEHGEIELVGRPARQLALRHRNGLLRLLHGTKQAELVRKLWRRAAPPFGGEEVVVSRTVEGREHTALDTRAGWIWTGLIKQGASPDKLKLQIQTLHSFTESFPNEGGDLILEASSRSAPDRGQFRLTWQYGSRSEWGTQFLGGLQIGRFLGRPVILTEGYKKAVKKSAGWSGALAFNMNPPRSRTRYRLQMGTIALPTFGLARMLIARIPDFPHPESLEPAAAAYRRP
jgi:hypothetical protein